ncbi:ABC transporter ATP-binding protein [Streptococcus catagoni]|uniref:ABC transporter ATP-binding protein n=1 Tax=Streptococcus catagoni TaxID=2654874 RepID=UPI00140D8312|nr:ABC transporter ATP-binding protein [Streptococcus catagoni]
MDTYKYGLYDSDLVKAKDLLFTYASRKEFACQIKEATIKKGELIVLCGKSGSGKSTFLKLINGLIPEYFPGHLEGQLTVGEMAIGQVSVEDLSRQVACVFQNPSSQFFYREVKHELVFPCENQGIEPQKIKEKLVQVANDFSFSDLLEREMYSLSGGQKQRVAIASAIMQGSELILFDEPTAHLDNQGIAKVRAYLAALKEAGKTIIIAEHRLSYLRDLADRYFYFQDGCLAETFSAQDFYKLSRSQQRAYGLRSFDLDPVQEELNKLKCKESAHNHDHLQIKGLQLKAGKKELTYIDQLSFKKGSITGLVGPNGIGKSRFAAYLAGIFEDKKALISLDGKSLGAKERLAHTAIVLQNVRLQLFADSVSKELCLGQDRELNLTEISQELGLLPLLDKHPMSLSGGEQQRVMIASCLLSDKDIFIFDEPSSGLDLEHMTTLSHLLEDLKAKGKIIILISHDEELLLDACDSIYEMPH